VHEILTDLEIGEFRIDINNRKVLQGFYEGLGIGDPLAVIRVADKLDKIGADGVREELVSTIGLTADQARACLDLAQSQRQRRLRGGRDRAARAEERPAHRGPGRTRFRLDSLSDLPAGSIRADLAIARGLDYYTGTSTRDGSSPSPATAASARAGATRTWPPRSSAATCRASACPSG
jgi:histidyl-tRNA synthetase